MLLEKCGSLQLLLLASHIYFSPLRTAWWKSKVMRHLCRYFGNPKECGWQAFVYAHVSSRTDKARSQDAGEGLYTLELRTWEHNLPNNT